MDLFSFALNFLGKKEPPFRVGRIKTKWHLLPKWHSVDPEAPAKWMLRGGSAGQGVAVKGPAGVNSAGQGRDHASSFLWISSVENTLEAKFKCPLVNFPQTNPIIAKSVSVVQDSVTQLCREQNKISLYI